MEMEIEWLKKSSRYKLNLPMTLYNGIKEIAAYSGTSSEAVMKYFIFRELLLYKTSPEQFWTQYKATKVVNEKSRKHAHVTICNYNDYVLQGIRKKEAEDEENDERYLVTIPKIINRLLYIETREFLGGYIYRDEKREKLILNYSWNRI